MGHFKYLNADRHLNHNHHGYVRPGLEPTQELTTWDIAWAAGIYEGEGHASLLKNANGSIKTQHVGVGQKERWLCDRLRSLFGGYVTDNGIFRQDHFVGKVNYKGRHKGWSWNIHGPRARGFLMTIYKFLSPRRQTRIKEVLV